MDSNQRLLAIGSSIKTALLNESYAASLLAIFSIVACTSGVLEEIRVLFPFLNQKSHLSQPSAMVSVLVKPHPIAVPKAMSDIQTYGANSSAP